MTRDLFVGRRHFRIVVDSFDPMEIEGPENLVVVVLAQFMFYDEFFPARYMLLFQNQQEFIWLRSRVVFDIEDV